jgi:hypothetical protein
VEPKRRFCFALDNVLVTYPQVCTGMRAHPCGCSLSPQRGHRMASRSGGNRRTPTRV